jgi:hypothetical protein
VAGCRDGREHGIPPAGCIGLPFGEFPARRPAVPLVRPAARKHVLRSDGMSQHAGVAVISSAVLSLLVGVVTQPAPARYAVSAAPLNLGSSGKLCIAVDPSDPHGIWWWQSGTDNCATRDTGPGLMKADEATVSTDSVGVHASFRLGLHGAPPAVGIRQ